MPDRSPRQTRNAPQHTHIAILTFQGFNELDSLIALGVLNRVRKPTWRVTLCCPEATVASMNGAGRAFAIRLG